jgi:hypothetical protein
MAAHSQGISAIPPVLPDQAETGTHQWLRDMAQSINALSSWVGTATGPGGSGSGTVTSVTAGTGLVGSPNPIIAAGTIALSVPVSIANGGSGSSTAAGAPWLTSNQTITLSGDLTGSGTTSINAQIVANAVGTTEIANSNVTYTKIQNVVAARLLGNPTGSAASPSEISLGTGLSFAGSVLNATTGGTGAVTSVAAGTGLVASPSPIVGVGTMSLAVPVSIANGGTGAITAAAGPFVQKIGDTMTGPLTITTPGTTSAQLVLNKPTATTANIIVGGVAGSTRWTIVPGDGSAGDDFAIGRWSDAGAFVGIPLAISRASGVATFGGPIYAPYFRTGLTTSGIGVVGLAPGSATVPGFIEWFLPNGTRQAFMGSNAGNLLLQVEQGGQFAIGNALLKVDGAISSTGVNAILQMQARSLGNTWGFYASANTEVFIWNANTGNDAYFDQSHNMVVYGNGYKPGGGVWADSSDIRTKEDIEDYPAGLDEVVGLRPVSFKHNGKGGTIRDGRRHVGLIAGEARLYMPEMVEVAGPKYNLDDKEWDDVLAIDATPMLYAFVNAFKEVKQRLETLEARGG